MLSYLQRGAVAEHSAVYGIECSLQSAFCILHPAQGSPCGKRTKDLRCSASAEQLVPRPCTQQ